MKLLRKHLIACFVSMLLLIGVTGFLMFSGKHGSAGPELLRLEQAESTIIADALQVIPDRLSLSLPAMLSPGLSFTYETSGQGYIDPNEVLSFQGLLEQTILATQPQLTVAWRFQKLQIDHQQRLPESDLAKIYRMADQGVIGRLDKDGVMQAVQGEEFWQSLLARIQYSATDSRQLQWQRLEWTSLGRFPANYQQERLDGNWQKSLRGQLNQNLQVQIDCLGNSPLDLQPVLTVLSCEEKIQFLSQNSNPTVTVYNQIQLSLKSWQQGPVPNATVRTLVGATATGSNKAAMDEQVHRRQLGQQTLTEILVGLQGQNEADDSKRIEPYLSLKAWLYLYPNKLPKLLAILREEGYGSPLFRYGVRAMTAIGHSASQESMRELVSWYRNEPNALRYLTSQFALLEQADELSENLLRDLGRDHPSREVRHSSQLALAVVGFRLRDQIDPDSVRRFVVIEQELLTSLHQASDPRQISLSLAYLGNLGSSDTLGYLSRSWQGADTELRMAMIRALRLVDEQQVWYWLLKALQDLQQDVRRQAIQVLIYRQDLTKENLQSLLVLMIAEPSDQVRSDWVQFLVGYSHRHGDQSFHLLNEWQDGMHRNGVILGDDIRKIIEQALEQMRQRIDYVNR